MDITLNLKSVKFQQSFTCIKVGKRLTVSQIHEMLNEGYSPEKIAEISGMSTRTIYNRIKAFNLELTKDIRKRLAYSKIAELADKKSVADISKESGFSTYRVKEWIKENFNDSPKNLKRKKMIELLQSNLPDREIARIANIKLCSVRDARRRYGIPKAEIRETVKNAQIEEIKKALNEGLTYSQIAERLKTSRSTIVRRVEEIEKRLNFTV